jgi:hypothetical protein
MVALARDAVGLSAAPLEARVPLVWSAAAGKHVPDPRLPSAYADLVAVYSWYGQATPHRDAELMAVNGCALVVRGLLCALGVPIEVGPIVDWGTSRGTVLGAFEKADALARDVRAFRDFLKPGNVIDLDGRGSVGSPFAARAHLAVVVDVEAPRPNGTIYVRTVDGGQREPGGEQCVRSKRTAFERAGIGDWRSPFGRLVAIGDVDALARAHGVT